jgi:GT2 family glycosyltransferase
VTGSSTASRESGPRVDGKFLRVEGERFLVRGVSYGTFAPDPSGAQFPPRDQMASDFALMKRWNFNTVRVYTPPPLDMLDQAMLNGLRVVVGLPWTQHVAFLDDRKLRREIRSQIVGQLRQCAAHPAALLFALGNEIPMSVVRWHGHRAVERFLRDLYDEAKSVAPEALLTYVNYPPTEYLDLPFFDVCAFNVYLHDDDRLRAYLARLQHIAGQKPLLVAEAGADSIREGESGQASLAAMQIRAAFREGACGAIAFAWTDDWWRGGASVQDWSFGLVDARRRPKAALSAVSSAFAAAPFDPIEQRSWPRASVVVCAHNAGATIDECLESLQRLVYPDFEIIVVNDGSTDDTGARLRRHRGVQVIDLPRGGLSRARNAGLHAAAGDIVAYCDADARVDPQWLQFLVQPLVTSTVVGSGGLNVVPAEDSWMAQCVARAPGAPTHVLLTDRIAEHVPGCNMAFRREALLRIDGFNPIYQRAGDDVDVCWRLQAHCGPIGFAPAALVWHHHRSSIRAYWRQQVGYGEGEEWLRPYHPDKFAGRRILWQGLVYSPLPFVRAHSGLRINGGVWGSAAFPSVYRVQGHSLAYMPHSARWQSAAIGLLIAGAALAAAGVGGGAPLALAGAAALTVTVSKCLAFAAASDIRPLPPIGRLPAWASRLVYRGTIALLHFIQPFARLHGRLRGLWHWPPQAPQSNSDSSRAVGDVLRLLAGATCEERFWSESWISRSAVLNRLADRMRVSRVAARFDIDDGWWTDRDISIGIAPALSLDVRTLIEDHGGGRCLVRAGIRLRRAWMIAALLMLTAATAAAAVWARTDLPSLRVWIEALAMATALAVAGVAARVASSATALSMALRGIAIEYRMFDTRRVPRGRPRAPGQPGGGRQRPEQPSVLSPAMAINLANSPPREIAQERR